ncbi:MAG: acetyl-CoA carboxylase biotin carboxyl carrier protein [Ruminococcus sp.]|jgi:acetyl-CoA carboxylase biotin carboxyl carrier protein|nr:acetyl-CoA carboxylase biotin carboxyl carrier protein [Ruminococcus flavefaciens]MBP3747084.1 acetyl-CoA carboxylase biotin carboxyl carrier protein [Ruminococcus sp.]
MSDIFGMVGIETIEKLADIINKKELSELTIADGDKTITIKGKKAAPVFAAPAAAAVSAQTSAPSAVETLSPSEASTAAEISGKLVKSPIVGTFYAAPSPDKPPFVRVGDEVKKGDVIMIIESMKLMNEIQSDYDGIVDKILVSDGQAVEYDQPIMVIK